MKKLILFALIVWGMVAFGSAQATSGTCSDHGGVNCSAGSDWDGSAICNDGWRDSSERFFSVSKCQDDTHRCTVAEYNELKSEYNIDDLTDKYNDLKDQLTKIESDMDAAISANSDRMAPMSTITAREVKIRQEASEKSSLILSQLKAKQTSLNMAINSVNTKCDLLGEDTFNKKQAEYLQDQKELFLKLAKEKSEPEYTCPKNSTLVGNKCPCNDGYIYDGDSCVTYDQMCQSKYGTHSYGNKDFCYCSSGYEFNEDMTVCKKKEPVKENLFIPSQVAGASTEKMTREQILTKINEIVALINLLKEQLAGMQ